MDRATFWGMIDEARQASRGDPEEQVLLLTDALAALPEAEIVEFQRILDQLMDESYAWELWAAAYIIRGGCSDDCFDYFRGWLIAQGETVFQNALRDPESLADVAMLDDVWLEGMLYVAHDAYERKAGREMPWVESVSWPREPAGDEWDEATVDAKYPRLAARFS